MSKGKRAFQVEGMLWAKAGGRKVEGKFKEFSSTNFHQYLPGPYQVLKAQA